MTGRRSPAIVLQVTSHAESDKIVTLFSLELGKITAIAKGAKRSRKRFVNKLEPFSSLIIVCRPPRKGSLFFLSAAELIDAYLELRGRYSGYVTAAFISELCRRFCGDQDPEPAIFTLLTWAFSSLARGSNHAVIATFFLLRLLEICGYQPQLTRCAGCGCSVDRQADFTFYPGSGTLLCCNCRQHPQQSSLHLTRQTLKFLYSGQQMPLSKLTRLHMSYDNSYQALAVLYNYSRHILQQDIHSWKQLAAIIRPMPATNPYNDPTIRPEK